jgi:hypothetical protein
MGKKTLPSQKVQDAINKQKVVKSPAAKKAYQKALTTIASKNERVRDELDRAFNFHLRLLSEIDGSIGRLMVEGQGWIDINPEVFEALYGSGYQVKAYSDMTVVADGVENNNNGTQEATLMRLNRDGSKTALSAKQLRIIKKEIFSEDEAGTIDLGHEIGIATKRMEVTLNVLRSIDLNGLPSDEVAQIKKLTNIVQNIIKLLNAVDKLETNLARKIFEGDGKALGAFLAMVRSGEIDVPELEVLTTESENFTSGDLLEKRTEFYLEDKELNSKMKGGLAKQITGALSSYVLSELDNESTMSKTQQDLIDFAELGSSPSLIDTIRLKIMNGALGKKYAPTKVAPKQGPKRKLPLLKQGKTFKPRRITMPRKGRHTDREDDFRRVGRLMGYINNHLATEIQKNMGRPGLENQTGTFANSAEVLSIVPDKRGLMNISYTYGDTYKVFEPGKNSGKYPTSYDPRGVIGKSIRTLAISQAELKFITRRV